MEDAIRRHGTAVYRLACACMHNRHDADDVFQDVFLRYAEKAPAFNDDEHCRAWLLRVTINRCRSLYRSSWWRRMIPLERAGTLSTSPPDDPALEQALDRLPVRYRTVLHLSCFEGMDAQEIAELLGVKPVSVRSQLSRARALLETLLKEGDSLD